MERTPVESLRKGLKALELLCGLGEEGLSLAELSERMSLKRNTTHNLLKTLCMCGYAENISKGRYRFGDKVGGLVRLLTSSLPISPRLAELLGQLAGELDETVVLATLVAGRRRVVMRSRGTRPVQVSSRAMEGDTGYLWQTPTGRVLAAFCGTSERELLLTHEGFPGDRWDGIQDRDDLDAALSAIRCAGVAEQHAGDVASLAVPVLGTCGVLLGAVGMHMPEYRWSVAARSRSQRILTTSASRLAGVWGDGVNSQPGE